MGTVKEVRMGTVGNQDMYFLKREVSKRLQ